MSNIMKNILRSTLIAVIITHFIFPSMAFAQAEWSGVCVGGPTVMEGRAADVATLQGFQCLIANSFSVIITVIGLAGFVMFIFGAFQWMLSGNNSKGVDTARQSMTYSVIGIVVALSGFIIINLIAGFTGVNIIKQFVIPTSDTPVDSATGGGTCIPSSTNTCPTGNQ
jgi:hypothetical protein